MKKICTVVLSLSLAATALPGITSAEPNSRNSEQSSSGASASRGSEQSSSGASASRGSEQSSSGASASRGSEQSSSGASASRGSEQSSSGASASRGSEKSSSSSSTSRGSEKQPAAARSAEDPLAQSLELLPEEPAAEKRVIVTFKTKPDRGAVEKASGRVNQEFKNIPALAISIPVTAIKGLQNNPNIESIESDQVVQTEQTQDWGIAKTNAPAAWKTGYTGKGIKVAVVDTGIESHEDLVITGGTSVISYTSSYTDDNGHGTHVAGIIGALNNSIGMVGIAPDSSLYAVKALDQNGSGYLSDVVAGIDWSISNNMDIVNLSLGTTSDSFALKQVVDKAYSSGLLVVAAAGNNGASDGSGDTVNYPARYDSAIAVAATDSTDQRASFSATGNTVEVAAPGVSVLSTYPGNRYVKMSGTSMAAPYVAGDLALLQQAYPTLSHSELRAKLVATVVDLGSAGKDSWFGYGLIQAPYSNVNEPAPTESSPLATQTLVTTNKSSYKAGESITITVKVKDSADKLLSSAAVSLTITNPRGAKTALQAVTNSSGTVSFNLTTVKNSVKGSYQVKAETSLNGYASSTASTSFSLR
ncbi:S8 family peptidase [Paenibacillus wulumuqiensis]|uniref:S8 family peptidase n=1 Tax=Paenibacillus wulumuqiensis TaxID=1567107 RepID=UPI0009E4857D|nr:S8 family serine peptidase [Paenibacillus wulumuqiensis]